MINSENSNLRTNNDQKIPDQNMNMNVIQFKMVNMQKTIPLDVSKELAGYKTLYIVNQYDPFRIFHYCCDVTHIKMILLYMGYYQMVIKKFFSL